MECVDLGTRNGPSRHYRRAHPGWTGAAATGRRGYVDVGGAVTTRSIGSPQATPGAATRYGVGDYRATPAAAAPSSSQYLIAAGGVDATTTRLADTGVPIPSIDERRFFENSYAGGGGGGSHDTASTPVLRSPVRGGSAGRHRLLQPSEALLADGHSPPVNPERVAVGLALDALHAGVDLPHPLTTPPWHPQPYQLPSAAGSAEGDEDATPWAHHLPSASPHPRRSPDRDTMPPPFPAVDTPGLRTLSAILNHGNSLVLDRARCLSDSITGSQKRLSEMFAATQPQPPASAPRITAMTVGRRPAALSAEVVAEAHASAMCVPDPSVWPPTAAAAAAGSEGGDPRHLVDRAGRTWSRSDEVLGSGASGRVWLGMGEEGGLVAIKMLPLLKTPLASRRQQAQAASVPSTTEPPPPPAQQQQRTPSSRTVRKVSHPALLPARRGSASSRRVGSSPLGATEALAAAAAPPAHDAPCEVPATATHVDEEPLEVGILRKLRHENIVRYHACISTPSAVAVVMEYVAGGTLQRIIDDFVTKAALAPPAIPRYTRDILTGVTCLHAHNIIHRDLKPANILITSSGRCKIADFGAAKLVAKADVRTNGTPMYMAPEACRGEACCASDVWSVGVIVHQLFTGTLPYPESQHPQALQFQLGSREDFGPVLPGPGVLGSVEGRAFVASCFMRDVGARPSAAELLRHAFLEPVVRGRREKARVGDGEVRSVPRSRAHLPSLLPGSPPQHDRKAAGHRRKDRDRKEKDRLHKRTGSMPRRAASKWHAALSPQSTHGALDGRG